MEKASESEDPEVKATRFIAQGNFLGALEVWKKATINDDSNPKYWRELSNVLDMIGESEKSKIAKDHADRIESQVISEKTGRKIEDILADLLDDGILNFSAGSDSSPVNNSPKSSEDDLTKLSGIGAVSSQRLNLAGITTFSQLSKMNDSEIMEIIKAKKLDTWSDMAKNLIEE